MGAKSHVSKWGTSLAIRIPKPIAEQWGVEEGSAIEIERRPAGAEKEAYDLNRMLPPWNPVTCILKWIQVTRRRGMVDRDYVPARGDIAG